MIGTQSVCRAEACDQLSVSGIKNRDSRDDWRSGNSAFVVLKFRAR